MTERSHPGWCTRLLCDAPGGEHTSWPIEVENDDPLAHAVRVQLVGEWVELTTIQEDLEGGPYRVEQALLTVNEATRLAAALLTVSQAASLAARWRG